MTGGPSGRVGTRRRAGVFALFGATATVVALALSVAPAAAAITTTETYTFADGNGVNHTCSIQLVREYPYQGDNQVGRGATTMLANGDPYCSDGIAYIGAKYKDPDGLEVTTEENSDGASTERRYAPVGSSFVTVHTVIYNNCFDVCTFTDSRSK